MATEEIKTARTIVLSEETAELFDCKKMLDNFYDKVIETHKKHFVPNEKFENKLSNAYVAINALIMDLLSETIDTNSNISNCKVI